MLEGEGFSLLFVNFCFISLDVKLKIHVHVMSVPWFVCACLLMSFGSGLGGVCSVHVKRCKRGNMCLAADQVGFDCLAEEGTTLAMFCVWGYVCPLSWHSWGSVSVCSTVHELTPLLLHVKLLGGSLPSCICVWEWWKLCLIPFTSYFWEIRVSGWVGWPYFWKGCGKMASKTLREILRGSLSD